MQEIEFRNKPFERVMAMAVALYVCVYVCVRWYRRFVVPNLRS